MKESLFVSTSEKRSRLRLRRTINSSNSCISRRPRPRPLTEPIICEASFNSLNVPATSNLHLH